MAEEISTEQLYRSCDLTNFEFQTTDDIQASASIIGQPRGTSALDFGLNISSAGYNIFILGESGTGRTTAVERFVEQRAARAPTPQDWVYVYNFETSHQPRAIALPAGQGRVLSETLERLIASLQIALQTVFDSPDFRQAVDEIEHQVEEERNQLLNKMQQRAQEAQSAIISTEDGLQIVPASEGQVLSPEQFGALAPEKRQAWQQNVHQLEHELEETMRQVGIIEENAGKAMHNLTQQSAAVPINSAMGPLLEQFQEPEELFEHLRSLRQDLLQNLQLFRPTAQQPETLSAAADPVRRYRVNVLVDHTHTQGAPVIVEYHPTADRLLGRVEYESGPGGGLRTDFSMIRGGVFHQAIGGYLVMRAQDLFTQNDAWEALKRGLLENCIQPVDPNNNGPMVRSINPEPIPLNLKVILIGPPYLYYRLLNEDPDFHTLFKVMSDFAIEMERTPENEYEYAVFIATRCQEEHLRAFDRTAVARVIEYGARLADSQNKLSTRFGLIANLVRESNYWAEKAEHERVSVEDVQRALDVREYHQNRAAVRGRQLILENIRLIASQGKLVGQINGLSVSQMGEFSFGQPSRITARVFAGQKGVLQIDREVNLAGPIHNKGVLILSGYLGGQYAEKNALGFTANITFEQNYNGVEGDSASSTELYALLSALSGFAIKQSIAVTGSVNQWGEIQAVGGVNEKIEGWFDVCQARGLDGQQGVMIPQANLHDLMLKSSVRQAIENGQFHIWAISHVDEGITLLSGKSAQKVHAAVRNRLKKFVPPDKEKALKDA